MQQGGLLLVDESGTGDQPGGRISRSAVLVPVSLLVGLNLLPSGARWR